MLLSESRFQSNPDGSFYERIFFLAEGDMKMSPLIVIGELLQFYQEIAK